MTTAAIATERPAGYAEMLRRHVAHYQSLGYMPLPSEWRPGEKKKPLVRYREALRGAPMDIDWSRWETPNVQLVTGCPFRLMVIDLDGEAAVEHWRVLSRGRTFRTWQVRTGSGGLHIYFTIPSCIGSLDSGFHWRPWDEATQAYLPHTAIERLADRKLAMAPPSIHPRTGRMYKFLPRCCPNTIVRPMEVPGFLLDLPTAEPTRRPSPEIPASTRNAPAVAWDGRRVGWRELSDAIPAHEKLALAKSWGLRVVSDRPNADGWCQARAIDREDRDPSATFHPESGRYWEAIGFPRPINLVELAARLGAWPSYREALHGLAAMYLKDAGRN